MLTQSEAKAIAKTANAVINKIASSGQNHEQWNCSEWDTVTVSGVDFLQRALHGDEIGVVVVTIMGAEKYSPLLLAIDVGLKAGNMGREFEIRATGEWK